MNKTFETITLTTSTIYGIINVKEVLGYILLFLSILQIVVNASISIYKNVKNKNINGVLEDINKVEKDLKELENTLNNDSKGSDKKDENQLL